MPDTCVRGFLHVLIAYSFMPEFVRPPPPEKEWKIMPLRFLSEIFLFFQNKYAFTLAVSIKIANFALTKRVYRLYGAVITCRRSFSSVG